MSVVLYISQHYRIQWGTMSTTLILFGKRHFKAAYHFVVFIYYA